MAKKQAVILAGGNSSRFGSDKCFAQINGKSFIEHIIEELNSADFDIVLSGPQKKLARLKLPIWEDASPLSGPLAAIQTCLQRTKQDLLLICAVDMPLLNADDYRELYRQSGAEYITCYEESGRPLPFPAIYPKSILPALIQQRAQGDESMQGLMRHPGTVALSASFPARLMNMNIPLDQ